MKCPRLIEKWVKLVLLLALFSLLAFQVRAICVQAFLDTVVRVEPCASSAQLGDAFTINIVVLNVQNLYGVEAALSWNSSVLELVNIDVRLGEADGILYREIFTAKNLTQAGGYFLAATSIAPAPSFSGNGIVVRLAFNVTSFGNSQLDLATQLFDYPPPDRNPRISLPIEHDTIDGTFESIVPEFLDMTILALFMVLTVFMFIYRKFLLRLPRAFFPFPATSNKIY